MFDGSVLHGVLPLPLNRLGSIPISSSDQVERITLMLGFWGSSVTVTRKKTSSDLHPNMQMPKVFPEQAISTKKTHSSAIRKKETWPFLLSPLGVHSLESGNPTPASRALYKITGDVWVAVDNAESLNSNGNTSLQYVAENDVIQSPRSCENSSNVDFDCMNKEFIKQTDKKSSSSFSSCSRSRSRSSRLELNEKNTRKRKCSSADYLYTAEESEEEERDDHSITFLGRWFLKSKDDIRKEIMNLI